MACTALHENLAFILFVSYVAFDIFVIFTSITETGLIKYKGSSSRIIHAIRPLAFLVALLQVALHSACPDLWIPIAVIAPILKYPSPSMARPTSINSTRSDRAGLFFKLSIHDRAKRA